MVSRTGEFRNYYNEEQQKILVEKFGTTDKKELEKLIKNESLAIEKPEEELSLKDKILLEKLEQLKEQRPFKLRKLKAETDIAESKSNFLTTFETPLSESGSRTLTKSVQSKYGFATFPSADENIQRKKNFFIDKHADSEYVGVCKVCQNFTTDICTTSREAEYDIETHLEIVHQKGLYQN